MTVTPDRRGEKWSPPPWHAPAQAEDSARKPGPGRGGKTNPRPTQSIRVVDASRPVVLGYAIAPAATGFLALLLALSGFLSGSGSVPFGLLILCVLHLVCYLSLRNGETSLLARSWLVALLATAGLLPLLSVQSTLLREPWIDADRGSAAPILVATFVVVLFVVVIAVWCTIAFASLAEISAIAFLLPALLVPGVLGIGSTIDQSAALVAIAEASILTAGALVLAWSLPKEPRLLVPPVAFVVQVSVLWLAGRGPSFPETNGGIVTLMYWVTVVVTAASTVLAPVASTWLRGAIAAVEEADRPRRSGSDEGDSPK